jgi:hypothetical protein
VTLAGRAGAWRAERRRAIVLETAAVSAGGTLAFFGAIALLDRFAALPRGARAAGLAAWGAGLAWVLAARLWKPWRALGWDAVFDAASDAWPKTRPVFASAWALRAGPAAAGTSEELRAEHAARADRLADELPDQALFAWKPSPAARRLAGAAAAVLAANAAWGDRASWTRALAPWRDAAFEGWVEVTPGDASLDWGAAAVVGARPNAAGEAAGVRAGALTFETRGSDAVWRPLPWTRVDARGAEWKLAALTAPLDYRVRWRDLTGRALRLTPAAPPRWTRAQAIVRDSRGEKRFTLGEDPAVRARRGDWVAIEAEPDAPLASAALRLSAAAAPVALRLEGSVWKGGFAASEDASMTFDLLSADGRRDPSPPAYALTVAADQPPVAELLSPQVPLVASPEDSIPVTWAARDDGAVTRAALVVSAGGRERSIPLAVPSPPRAEALGDYSWALTGFAPGAKVEFWIEAWDDASPPQTGRSERGSVEIVDAAADHAAALAARDAADAAVERAAAEAEAARDAARKGDLASSSEKERALRPDWSAAAKALAEWAKRSAVDPRGDTSTAEEAQRANEEFSRAGQEGLPAAEKALAAADAPTAAREQSALADQARGVQKSMREGAKAQDMADHADKMAQAGKAADDMASAAAALAARGKDGTVSAAELEKLQQSLSEVEKALDELRKAVKSMPEISPEQAAGATAELPLNDARESAGELQRALQSGDVAAAAKAAKRLAQQLKKMSQTLDEAGRRAAEAHGQKSSEAAGRVARAWQEAVDAQTRAAEAARKVSDARQADRLRRQRDLLSQVSADFDRLVSSRAASGAPANPGADAGLAETSRRLKAADATGAAAMMRDTASRLGPDPFGTQLRGLAAKLDAGPPPAPADAAAARGAAESQSSSLEHAHALRGEVDKATRESGYLSGRLGGRVDSAISEEDAGRQALEGGDSGEGLKHAEAALSILQEGSGDADAAAGSAGAMMPGAGPGKAPGPGGVVMRGAPHGTSGSALQHVRLPSADEYRPPRELREELERSLQEPHPASDDAAIKEYFKRLSR